MCKCDVLGIFQLNFEYHLILLIFTYYSYVTHIKPMTPKPDGLRVPGGKTPFRPNMQVE